MKTKLILALTLLALLTSCFKEDNNIVKGLKPIYISNSIFSEVETESPKPFIKIGKIFQMGNTIFISDIGTGVHVVDNTNPALPVKIAFISINGNSDVLVKNNTMYADNASNLLVIDINDINNAELKKVVEEVYSGTANMYPKSGSGYFECVDYTKGMVIDWVEAELTNPDCQI